MNYEDIKQFLSINKSVDSNNSVINKMKNGNKHLVMSTRKSVPKPDYQKIEQSLNNSRSLKQNVNVTNSVNQSYSQKMMNSFMSVNNSSNYFNFNSKTRFRNFYDPRNVMRIDDFRCQRYDQNSKNVDDQNSSNILKSFQKSLKEQFLQRKFGKVVGLSLRETQLFNRSMHNDEFSSKSKIQFDKQKQMSVNKLDVSKFDTVRKDEQLQVMLNVVDGEKMEKVVKQIDHSQFIEKYQNHIMQTGGYDYWKAKQKYQNILTNLNNKHYTVILRDDVFIQQQNYNDYYKQIRKINPNKILTQDQVIEQIIHHEIQNQHQKAEDTHTIRSQQQEAQVEVEEQEQEELANEEEEQQDSEQEQVDKQTTKQTKQVKQQRVKNKKVKKRDYREEYIEEQVKKKIQQLEDDDYRPMQNYKQEVIKIQSKMEDDQQQESDHYQLSVDDDQQEQQECSQDDQDEDQQQQFDGRNRKTKNSVFKYNANMFQSSKEDEEEEEDEQEQDKIEEVEEKDQKEKHDQMDDFIKRKTQIKIEQKQLQKEQEEHQKQMRLQQLMIHNDTDNTDSELESQEMQITGYGKIRNTVILDKLLEARDLFDLNLNEYFEHNVNNSALADNSEEMKYLDQEEKNIYNEVNVWRQELALQIQEGNKEYMKEKKRIFEIFQDVDQNFIQQHRSVLEVSESDSD